MAVLQVDWLLLVSLGTTLVTCRGHSYEVLAVTWSPDGQHIASAISDKTMRVWIAAT